VAARYIVAVLEDDEDHRELIAAVLRDAGHIALLFEAPQSLPPAWRGDAIITDTFSLHYDSAVIADAIATLRRKFSAAIVLVSAHLDVVRDYELLGADAVVSKPFEIDTLVATVERAILKVRGQT